MGKQNPLKMPGQSQDIFFHAFCCSVFLRSPNKFSGDAESAVILAEVQEGSSSLWFASLLSPCVARASTELMANDLLRHQPSSITNAMRNVRRVSLHGFEVAGLTGTFPESLRLLVGLADLDVAQNDLAGALPDFLGRTLVYLNARQNRIAGAVPESLCLSPVLKNLDLRRNELTGIWQQDLNGIVVQGWDVSNNQLSGSIPDGLTALQRLECLRVTKNLFTGALPQTLWSLRRMSELWITYNKFWGVHFPASLGSLRSLMQIWSNENDLDGAIPDSIGSLKAMFALTLEANKLSGSIPSSLRTLRLLRGLDLTGNRLRGPLPDAFGALLLLPSLHVSRNSLSSSLPDGIGHMDPPFAVELSHNRFTNTLPNALQLLQRLMELWIRSNSFAGTIPHAVSGMKHLEVLALEENKFSGILPLALGSMSSVKMLICGRNFWEGTLPNSLGMLQSLKLMDIPGKEEGSSSRHHSICGMMPSSLARLPFLTRVVLPSNRLEGPIPALAQSLDVCVLHQNSLQSLPGVHFTKSAQMRDGALVLLHRNRLSCRLPADNTSNASTTLVGLGNHLTYPRYHQFPGWVSNYEHDEVFWIERSTHLWLFIRFYYYL